jgi:hypothetical protein
MQGCPNDSSRSSLRLHHLIPDCTCLKTFSFSDREGTKLRLMGHQPLICKINRFYPYMLQTLTQQSPTKYFAFCESCHWSASLLLGNLKPDPWLCPVCFSESITLVPLAKYESYRFEFSEKGGLIVYFSTMGSRN